MPDLDFAVGQAGRPTYGLPTLATINCYAEPTKAGPKQAARISRPGLTLQYTNGSGPVLRAYQNPGIFNGDPFFISQGTFYRGSTSIGAIPYSTQPRMAATTTQLAITSGGALYVYTTAGLALVEFFDDGVSRLPPFSSVAVLYNIFIYSVAGTNTYYWSQAGDATSINALNVTAAQTSPDQIIELAVLAEELYIVKALATEIWDFNPIVNSFGQVTQPFQLSQGRTYIRGTPAQGSVVSRLDNAMFWIGDDLEVYRSGAVPIKVSTPFIDDRLRAAKDSIAQTTAFALGIEGHWLYVFNLPMLEESYAYDCATQEWAQWGTQETLDSLPGLFIGGCATGQGATIWLGDVTSGNIYLLDVASNTDNGLARAVTVSAAIWVTGGAKRLNNVSLACVRGGGTNTDNPVVWMRLSYDGGRTFTSWIEGQLGFRGQYDWKAAWRNLGIMRQPGVQMEFTVFDNVPVIIEGGSFNEGRV